MESAQKRSQANVEALKLLKQHLTASRSAGCPADAIEILRAAAKVANPLWKVAEIGTPEAMSRVYADGTVTVMLNAHKVLINPNGAYRIIELHPPESTFHECASNGGSPFVVPAGESQVGAVWR